jgi:cyclase
VVWKEEFMKLTANVYVETRYPGANVGYVTTDDGIVMVESPYRPTDAVEWRREIESKGPLRYLIYTEPHHDHYAGGFFFDTTAVAHEKSREAMLAADIKQLKEAIANIDPEGLPLIEHYRINIPAITFSERLTLYLGRHRFHLFYMPGHSAGQLAAFVPEEKVVFTGDNVTYRLQGFVHEADPFAWLESLERLGELEVDHIVPGHGDVCDKSYLEEQASYVQGCMDAVRKAIDQGWTKDEAVARVSFPSPYPHDPDAAQLEKQLTKVGIANLYERLSK